MVVVRWFDEVSRGDVTTVGGKGVNLGELTSGGFPLPPGFVVTADAYVQAMDDGGVRAERAARFGMACTRWTIRVLGEAAARLQALVRKAGVPETIVGDRRGHRGHLVRRDARDVRQRDR
jgi:pyruvate, water dikinase